MIFEKVCEIIEKEIGIDTGDIKMETSFEELNIDSLDMFQIIIDIEEEFNIKIEEAEKIKTVKDAVEFIKERVEEN